MSEPQQVEQRDGFFALLVIPLITVGPIVVLNQLCPDNEKVYCLPAVGMVLFSMLFFPVPFIRDRVSIEVRAKFGALALAFTTVLEIKVFADQYNDSIHPATLNSVLAVASMIIFFVGKSVLPRFMKQRAPSVSVSAALTSEEDSREQK